MYFCCNQPRRKSEFSLAWASWSTYTHIGLHACTPAYIYRDIHTILHTCMNSYIKTNLSIIPSTTDNGKVIFIHSFIPDISIAPLEVHYYSAGSGLELSCCSLLHVVRGD